MKPRYVALLVVLGMLLIVGPFLPSPQAAVAAPLTPPGEGLLLGADQFGRSIFVRTVWSARRAAWTGLIATGTALAGGLLLGVAASGLPQGWAAGFARLIDVLLAVPGLVIALGIMVALQRGPLPGALAAGVGLIPSMARFVRFSLLTERERAYVTAARAQGAGGLRLAVFHVLPNLIPGVLTFTGTIFGWAVLNLTALDFLGVAASPSDAALGRMLDEGRRYLADSPWAALAPGLALMTLVSLALSGNTKNATPR